MHLFHWPRRCLLSQQRLVLRALSYIHEHLKASTENAVHTSEAHLQPPSPFFRTAGWAKIVIVGSKSLERGTHFCKDLWASTSFKMFWIITWVHSPFSFRLDIANDDKCHIHITLQQVSVPHAVFQRLLQALVSLVHSVTPRLFRFIHKFPTYEKDNTSRRMIQDR